MLQFQKGPHPVLAMPHVELARIYERCDGPGREVLRFAQGLANADGSTKLQGAHLATALVGLGHLEASELPIVRKASAVAELAEDCRAALSQVTAADPSGVLARPFSYMWSVWFASERSAHTTLSPAHLYAGVDDVGMCRIAATQRDYEDGQITVREAARFEIATQQQAIAESEAGGLAPGGWGRVPPVPGVDLDQPALLWLARWLDHEIRRGHRIPLAVLLAVSGTVPVVSASDNLPGSESDLALDAFFDVPEVRLWKRRLAAVAKGRRLAPKGWIRHIGLENVQALQAFDAAIGADDTPDSVRT